MTMLYTDTPSYTNSSRLAWRLSLDPPSTSSSEAELEEAEKELSEIPDSASVSRSLRLPLE